MTTDRLISVDIDDTGLPAPTPEIEQERRVAVFDLLEENSFAIVPRDGVQVPAGPYALLLAIRDGRLALEVSTQSGAMAGELHLALGPFRQVVKDYFQICESYYDAVKHLPAAQIEAIDMGRRGIHDEGARLLQERLEGKLDVDKPTAKRLFTLICVLHFKG